MCDRSTYEDCPDKYELKKYVIKLLMIVWQHKNLVLSGTL